MLHGAQAVLERVPRGALLAVGRDGALGAAPLRREASIWAGERGRGSGMAVVRWWRRLGRSAARIGIRSYEGVSCRRAGLTGR